MVDLKLAYIVAEKDSITIEEIRQLIRRVFAAYFCEEWGYEKELISNLVNALYAARLVEEDKLSDDSDGDTPPAWLTTLSNSEAENAYCEECVRLYMANGADRAFAEEASSWPDVLPLDAYWDRQMLNELAALEVGHDMLVGEVLGALSRRENAPVA